MRGNKSKKMVKYEDDYDDVDFFFSWKHMLFSLLLHGIALTLIYIVFVNNIHTFSDKASSSLEEGKVLSQLNVSENDRLLLRRRYEDLVTLDGVEIDRLYLPTYSNTRYCVGDIVDTAFADFQILDVRYEDLDEYYNRAYITMSIENKGMYGGIRLTENTSTIASNSPKIVANVTNRVGGLGLTLSKDYTSTLINKGSTVMVVGTLKIRKSETIESLLIGFDKDVNTHRQVDCTLKLKELNRGTMLIENFNKYEETGVIRATADDVVYLENGVSIQVLGKYYRSDESKFSIKPYKDKIDIGVEVKITNNSDKRIPIAERFNFVLVDSNGYMHDEVIYPKVLNMINNTYDRPILDKDESLIGYINFEAYDDMNHRLLISERKQIVPYEDMPIYNASTERQDSPYMVAIKLPEYGWSSDKVVDIENSLKD